MSRTVRMICASLLISAVAVPALAQNPPPRSERVSVGDLDLYNAKEADLALERLDGAAADLCADRSRPVPPTERRSVAECEVVAVDNAVRDYNHPMLTARNEGLNPNVIISEGDADAYHQDDKK